MGALSPQPAGLASEIRAGIKASIPVLVSAAPFGLLFGALAADNGLTSLEAVVFSATVFGGASQMVGIELFGAKALPWLIVAMVFAINFRHVLYSAALANVFRPWPAWQKALGFFLLTDPQFAETARRADLAKGIGFAWYLAMGLSIYFTWLAEAWIGAEFGRLVENPRALGIDFLLPIYFLGLVMSFRQRPRWLPIVVVSWIAALAAYVTIGSPWHVSIGGLAGIGLATVLPPPAKPGTQVAAR
jgi:predicted branched-subunit amino acid permease